MHPTLAPFLLLLAPVLGSAQEQEAATPTAPGLEQSLAFLGSKGLEGRIAGSEGCREAAEWIATRLEEMGFEGLAAEGGMLDAYPAQRIEYPSAPKLLFRKKDGTIDEGRFGVDFNLVVRGEVHSTDELAIRRVTRLSELPVEASAQSALFLRGSAKDRQEWLGIRGQGDGEGWGLDLRLGSSEEQGKPKGPPETRVLYGPEDEGCEIVYLRGPMREALLWKGYTSVQLVFDERRTDVSESTVIAALPGADAELAREVVLLQAGYDGIPGARTADTDGGSSAAVLLDVARRVAARGPAPRTLVVLFTSGTPKVRRGLGRFLEEPPFDLERLRHVITLAELGRPGREMGAPRYLWMTGVRSSLGEVLRESGLPIRVPPRKLAKRLRGAAVAFAQAGHPANRAVAPYSAESSRNRGVELGPLDLDYLAFVSETLGDAVVGLLTGEIEVPEETPGKSGTR